MNTKFKRHQSVKILAVPDKEFIEYHNLEDEELAIENHPDIKAGMTGKINMVLPNGRYHVELQDKKGNIIAYAPFSEEELETAD
jgi:hypothetical protein